MSPSPSTQSSLTRNEALTLSTIASACLTILANALREDADIPLIVSLALSGLAFSASYALIRWLGPAFMRAGFRGVDLAKPVRREIPEGMGAVCAAVYLFVMIVFVPFVFYRDVVAATSGGGNRDVVVSLRDEAAERGVFLHRFPHSKLASYLSAMVSLHTVASLGLADDLFDIRWRHKFFIPAFAAIPLLVVYAVDFGVTSVVVPRLLQPCLGPLLDLGGLYYVYMAAVAIFGPNSINILAGINGIEVAQSVVIASLLALNDALYLLPPSALLPRLAGLAGKPYPHPATDSHLFSLSFLLPFLGVSLALLCHNAYPARVFVGDTYCYFAGTVFVVVGILGHFSKTLLLLLVPQIFNFVYSAPQLFGLVPCPRHRMPRFNARTGLLEPSVTTWPDGKPPRKAVEWGLRTLGRLGLLRVVVDKGEDGKERIVETSNLTLLNLWLVWRGPMKESRLTLEVTMLQAAMGLAGLVVRYRLALLVFSQDNI
ncbi:hypothetical protein VTJ83DRAFT_4724 [Remersonia thermophila]|uniref:UDP-N-acetylglucosamine--dolichyl-phosphate N-acetylglucosaminephosphotransferase n=1 Tax=Remersonia thermophila TaxID=72144 RepID=A0ABR4DAZ7_9PEZI